MNRLLLVLLLVGCTQKAKTDAAPVPTKPAPLEPLTAEPSADGGVAPTYTVKPFTFSGDPAPSTARRLEIVGEAISLDGKPVTVANLPALPVVLLSFDADAYLAQQLPLLARLDDAGAEVWLQSPDVSAIAWPVKLRDEANFNVWLDDGGPGKLRIVHRTDGFELQTNMGKLAGADARGPTVPTRGGSYDLVMLQKGLDRVKARFTAAADVCFMPTYAMPMRDAIRAIATNWISKDSVVFGGACLVYPRPATRDAGT